jgi:polysaccharide biosynthesis/export protein
VDLSTANRPSVDEGFMTRFRYFIAHFAIGFLLTVGAAVYQTAEAQSPGDQQHMSQLGPGDSVSIQVFGQPDITSVYVGDDGTISVPLVGNIPVGGTSPVQAAARVAKALKDGGYFVDPHVTILVTQQRNQVVSVVGEVTAVGRYPINPRTTIVDLLAQAGGLRTTASDSGFVLRPDESGHISRYPVQLTGLSEFKLAGGDSLLVPKAEHFSIQGEVASPGIYPIEPGMTLIQALARAGGINERGSERRIELKRLGKNGQYQVLHAKLGDSIQADDIIRVKESIF